MKIKLRLNYYDFLYFTLWHSRKSLIFFNLFYPIFLSTAYLYFSQYIDLYFVTILIILFLAFDFFYFLIPLFTFKENLKISDNGNIIYEFTDRKINIKFKNIKTNYDLNSTLKTVENIKMFCIYITKRQAIIIPKKELKEEEKKELRRILKINNNKFLKKGSK